MPLTKGKSKKTISKNISEFHTGKTYQHTKEKFGKAAADKQAVAVALNEARKSGAKVPRKPKHKRNYSSKAVDTARQKAQ